MLSMDSVNVSFKCLYLPVVFLVEKINIGIDIVLNGVFGHQDVSELTYQNLHFSHVRRNYVLKRINSFRSALIIRYRYQLLFIHTRKSLLSTRVRDKFRKFTIY